MTKTPMNKRAVLALLGSSAAIFWPGALVFGFPGVMAPYWQRLFQVGRGAIGNTLFFMLVALGIFMFFVGRWQEKYGMRRMITIGTGLLAVNMLIISFTSNLLALYLWAFLSGAASSFIYTPALTCVQRWFPQRRGLVSGVVNFTFGISAAIMSPLFQRMLESMGYRAMNLTVAALTVVTGLLAARFTEGPDTASSAAIATAAASSPASGALLAHSMTVRESLATRSFWFLWLTWAFQGAAGVAMVTLSIAFGVSKGYATGSAVVILTAFNLMNGGGRIVMGYLSDFVDRNLAMSVAFLAAGGAYLLLPHVSGLAAIALLASVIGFGFGTLFAVSAPLAADCFGMRHFGAIFGMVFTAYGFCAGLLGPTLSGYLLDSTGGNFGIVFGYLGGFCILSGGLIRLVVPLPLESRRDGTAR